MAGRNRRRSQAFQLNLVKQTLQYNYYFEYIQNIALSRFKWTVSDNVDKRHLEFWLQTRGKLLVFRDEVLGMLALPYSAGGRLDIYNHPITRYVNMANGYHNILDNSNSVFLFNNFTHSSIFPHLEIFAARLANLDITADVNINAQKTPVIIEATDTTRQTMLNAYMQYDGGFHFIFGDKDFNIIDNIKVIDTKARLIAPELQEVKAKIWNELLTFLGIPSVEAEKKERLVVSEVNRSMGGVFASRTAELQCRQEACEEINKMFGTNWSCEFNDFSDNSEFNMPKFETENSEEGSDE